MRHRAPRYLSAARDLAPNSPKANLDIDLKPENLLFRTKEEDADIMIADFGLSRVLDDEKFHLLTEICGTPGVRACSVVILLILTRLTPSSAVHGSGDLQKE